MKVLTKRGIVATGMCIIMILLLVQIRIIREESVAAHRAEVRMFFDSHNGDKPLGIPDNALDKAVAEAGLTMREAAVACYNLKRLEKWANSVQGDTHD